MVPQACQGPDVLHPVFRSHLCSAPHLVWFGLSHSAFPQLSAGSPQSEAVCVQGVCALLCVPYGIPRSTDLPCEVCMVGGGGKEGQLEGQWLFYFYWPVAGGHSFQSLPSALPPQPAVCGEAQASLTPRGLN